MTLLEIENVLAPTELAGINEALDAAQFADGRITAGHQSREVKSNLQLPEDAPVTQALTKRVLAALGRNALFVSAALPRAFSPVLFNHYDPGMVFGAHVDSAIRGNPPLRTDLACTLFLNEPECYDGGELVIAEPRSERVVKMKAGHLVLYCATTVHQVRPITRGTRRVAVFWMQSLVRDVQQRAILFDLDRSIIGLGEKLGLQDGEVIRLSACYHNLLRLWADV